MSVAVMAEVFNVDLPPKEKLLLLALADHADEYGNNVYPSVATMCRKTSMPERTVQRTLGALRDRGVLVQVAPPGQHRPAQYRIVVAGLDQAPAHVPNECPKAMRLECIEVFEHECQYCHERGDEKNGPDGKAWHVERLIPGKRGGTYEPYNITLACGTCNRKKGANLAPQEIPSMGATLDARGAKTSTQTCQSLAPKPSIEPPEEPSDLFTASGMLTPVPDFSPEPAASGRSRRVDPVWQAFEEANRGVLGNKKVWGIYIAKLKALPGVTVSDILRAIDRASRTWRQGRRDYDITPMAVYRRWAKLYEPLPEGRTKEYATPDHQPWMDHSYIEFPDAPPPLRAGGE